MINANKEFKALSYKSSCVFEDLCLMLNSMLKMLIGPGKTNKDKDCNPGRKKTEKERR